MGYKEEHLYGTKNEYEDRGYEFYNSIRELHYYPKHLYKFFIPTVRRGEWYWWKLFGIIPLIPFKASEDLYKAECWHSFLSRYCTHQEALDAAYKMFGNEIIEEGNGKVLYFKPSVVYKMDKCGKILYFDTDKDAADAFNYIKKMCKKCDNELEF